MTMIPVGSGEQQEINSLEQQARAEYGHKPAAKPAKPQLPRGHQERAKPHKEGMTYGERGDVSGKVTPEGRATTTQLKGFLGRGK